MRLIIEARMIAEAALPTGEILTLAEIERNDRNLTEFGRSLAEGRALLSAKLNWDRKEPWGAPTGTALLLEERPKMPCRATPGFFPLP